MCFDTEKTQAPGIGFEHRLRQEKEQWGNYEAAVKAGREEDFGRSAQAAGSIGNPAYSEQGILAELFSYHPPTPNTLPKFAAINQAAKNFAEVILQNCPPGADRTVVINCIRNARMFANAAITLDGLSL